MLLYNSLSSSIQRRIRPGLYLIGALGNAVPCRHLPCRYCVSTVFICRVVGGVIWVLVSVIRGGGGGGCGACGSGFQRVSMSSLSLSFSCFDRPHSSSASVNFSATLPPHLSACHFPAPHVPILPPPLSIGALGRLSFSLFPGWSEV